MALKLVRYGKDGPEIPPEMVGRRFRSFVDMANFADKVGLPDGQYISFNPSGCNLLTATRLVTRKGNGFRVEGRGNV